MKLPTDEKSYIIKPKKKTSKRNPSFKSLYEKKKSNEEWSTSEFNWLTGIL